MISTLFVSAALLLQHGKAINDSSVLPERKCIHGCAFSNGGTPQSYFVGRWVEVGNPQYGPTQFIHVCDSSYLMPCYFAKDSDSVDI